MDPNEIHLLLCKPISFDIVHGDRGESWSLPGNRFKQRCDLIPDHLRRAMMSASSDGKFNEFLMSKIDNKAWSIDLSCDGVSLSRDLFYEFSINPDPSDPPQQEVTEGELSSFIASLTRVSLDQARAAAIVILAKYQIRMK